jgi:MinD-like ATPase involved in chromosome partitioning or flagellar assembly
MIVTFYSYKGGAGRTLALANVAVLMARQGHRVLVADFDLEAPGMSRFLQREAPTGLALRHNARDAYRPLTLLGVTTP